MIRPVRISKAVVVLGLLFFFLLGAQFGFLLEFMESGERFDSNRRSLEDTANELIPR